MCAPKEPPTPVFLPSLNGTSKYASPARRPLSPVITLCQRVSAMGGSEKCSGRRRCIARHCSREFRRQWRGNGDLSTTSATCIACFHRPLRFQPSSQKPNQFYLMYDFFTKVCFSSRNTGVFPLSSAWFGSTPASNSSLVHCTRSRGLLQ